MVSLAQAKAVRDLEAEGWVIVEASNEHVAGGRVMMTSTIGGHARYIWSCLTASAARNHPPLRKFKIGR
jgi:hypothetical protein